MEYVEKINSLLDSLYNEVSTQEDIRESEIKCLEWELDNVKKQKVRAVDRLTQTIWELDDKNDLLEKRVQELKKENEELKTWI